MVACLELTRYPTEIRASRLYNIGCFLELGLIIRLLLLVELFVLRVISSLTNSSVLKILFKCLLIVFTSFANNYAHQLLCDPHSMIFQISNYFDAYELSSRHIILCQPIHNPYLFLISLCFLHYFYKYTTILLWPYFFTY